MSRQGWSASLLASWRSVGRDSLIYLVGEGGGKGVTYLLLILVARFAPVEEFGAINLFIAVTGLLAVVVGLGLPDALLRFFFRELDFRRVLGTSLALILIGGGVVGLALAGFRDPISRLLHLSPSLAVLAVVGVGAMVLRSCWLTVLRAQQRSLSFALARWAEPLLMAIGIGLLLALEGSLGHLPVLRIYVAAILALAVVGLTDLWRSCGLRFGFGPARELLAFAVPLVPHALAMTGLASFDQVVISQLLGLEQTGLYALAYRFGMAMFLIAFGVASAWNPLVYRELGQSERGVGLGATAKRAFRVAILVAVLLCFALPGLAVVVGGPAFAPSARLIPIVVYGYLWMMLYSLAVPFLTFDNRTGTLARSSAAAFAVNAALNYLLIPQYGVTAAALTTVASYVLLFLLVWRRLDRSGGVPFGRLLQEALAFAPVCWLAWLIF